jgi:YVTN family beta-propeller protein
MLSRIGAILALLCCAAPSIAQSVMTNVTVAGTPAGVAVNPGNNRIYVGLVNQSDYSVSVIDGATNSVIDNVPLSTGALVDAVNITTGRVYVAGCTYTQAKVTCGVSVLDSATDKVIATIPINAANGIGLEGIAVNPVTNRIYVADAANFQVDVIDGYKSAMLTTISMGGHNRSGWPWILARTRS